MSSKEKESEVSGDDKTKKIHEDQFNSTRIRSVYSSKDRKLTEKKKNKFPRSTNYHFTTNNLTEPTFMVNPDRISKKGEKNSGTVVDFDENESEKPFEMFTRKEELKKSSKAAYVIDANGFCIPLRGGDDRENAAGNFFANNAESINRGEFSNESNSNNNNSGFVLSTSSFFLK